MTKLRWHSDSDSDSDTSDSDSDSDSDSVAGLSVDRSDLPPGHEPDITQPQGGGVSTRPPQTREPRHGPHR